MLKLLIATDGSAHAERAIQAAGRLARDVPDLKVLLLNVREVAVSHGALPNFDHAALEETARREQEARLEDALQAARTCGLEDAVTLGTEGPPAAEIARVAAEHAVDQIVIGTHGRNALAGLLLGSVAQRVVQLAGVPVLLVK